MTTTIPASVFQIARNDFAAAQRYYEKYAPIDDADYTVLARLQDDLEAFEEKTAHWLVIKDRRRQ
jgi:hypothetical protein